MPIQATTKLIQYWHEVQAFVAVIFGMLVQYYYGEKHNRLVVSVVISSVFVALFIVPAFIDIINYILGTFPYKIQLDHSGNVAIMLYAVSSLISVHILAMVTVLLPQFIRVRVEKVIGVRDVGDE